MDPLKIIYDTQAPKTPLPVKIGRLVMGKAFISVAVSAFVAAMMQMGYLRWIVVMLCHFLILVFGKGEPPEPIKEKIKVIGREIKEHVPAITPHKKADGPTSAPTEEPKPAPVGFVAKFEEKVGEKIAPAKEAAVKATKKVEAKAVEARETVKEEAKKVGEKLDALKGSVGERGPHGDRHDAEEQLEGVGESVPARDIAKESEAAARAFAAKGRPPAKGIPPVVDPRAPNGQCPGCHLAVRVPTSGTQRYRCRICKTWYSGRQARHAGPPRVPSLESMPNLPANFPRR